MTSLYNIDVELQELLNTAQEFDEETPPDQVDKWLADFEEQKGERKNKLEAIMHMRNASIYSTQTISFEIERLQGLMAKQARIAEKMGKLMELSMRNAGESEIKTDLFHAKFVKNPPKLILSPELESIICEKYQLKQAEEKLKEAKGKVSDDKKQLKDMLKRGEAVDGARLEQAERLKIE